MKRLHYLAIAVLLGGCEEVRNPVLAQKLDATNAEIAKLQNEVNQLREDLQAVKASRDFDDLFKDIEKIAYLTPESDGYAVVKYDLGVITVTLADIKPYANGAKISLKFGNPLSATVNGLKATLEWGKVDADGRAINDQAKSKEITFNQKLKGGAWTTVPVVLEGFPPTELGFVRVKDVAHSGVELTQWRAMK